MLGMGYLLEYCPDHPRCTRYGYVQQHRLVAEAVLGRYLTSAEVVHHEDRCKTNNAPENLWVFPDHSTHMRHHKRESPRYDMALYEALIPLAADEGTSIQQAAEMLGTNLWTVRAVCDVRKLPWVSSLETHLDEAQVREALRGKTTLEAASSLGVNHQTLRNNFPHLLAKRASPGFLEAHKDEIRSLASRVPAAEVADHLGVCAATVKSYLRRWMKEEPGEWSGVSEFRARQLRRPKPRRKASGQ